MFPSFSSPCFHECCSHHSVFSLGKAVKAQMEMPTHKEPFFSVSKLMSMNHRLIGKSVPIPELLFLMFTPLCSVRGAQQQELSSPASRAPLAVPNPGWPPAQTGAQCVLLPCSGKKHKQVRTQHHTTNSSVHTHTSQGLSLLVFMPIHSLSD